MCPVCIVGIFFGAGAAALVANVLSKRMFKSKAQARKIAVLTGQGKFPMKSFKEWAESTKSYKKLPERLKKKK